MRRLKNTDTLVLTGHQIYHNCFRPHMALAGNLSPTHDFMVSYTGLVWSILTNLGGEDTVVLKSGAIDGYTSFIGFNPTKQKGLVVPF